MTLVLSLMMAGVTLVLFIACSNVANLLLARAAAPPARACRARRPRRRPRPHRPAAAHRSRGPRARQRAARVWRWPSFGTRLISAQIPPDDIPYYIQWRVDWRSLVYTIAVAVSTALVFGLVPALQTTRRELQESLKEGARGSTGGRALVRNALVIAQVSLALVALVGALLFVRSFRNLDTYELGFETSSLMTLRFYMTGDGYEPKGAKLRRVEDVIRRVEALPGVQAAFASNLVPIDGGGGGGEIEVEGRTNEQGQRPRISFTGVTPNLHKTLGVTVRRGRDFTEAESWATRPVAIINEAMAKRVWPNEDPIDRRFRLWSQDGSQRVAHRDRRRARPAVVRDRSGERAGPGGGVRALWLSGDVEHRADHSRRR